MRLSEVREWVKTFGVGERFYVGKLDNKKEKSIGVYSRPAYDGADIAIGGKDATKTGRKQVSILVHWNRNADETEEAAQELYEAILDRHLDTIGGKACYIQVVTPEAVDVGTDANGVYERVIWLTIYHER